MVTTSASAANVRTASLSVLLASKQASKTRSLGMCERLGRQVQ